MRPMLQMLKSESGTLSPSTAAQQHGPLSWGTADAPSTSMPCPYLTHKRSGQTPGCALPTLEALSLFGGAGKKKQVAVRVFDDEVFGAPWLLLQCLEERDVCGLELEVELLNLIGAGDGHRCRQ